MTLGLINANPVVHERRERISRADDPPHHPCHHLHPDDVLDALDVFGQFQRYFFSNFDYFLPGSGFSLILFSVDFDFLDSVRDIRDPEHPYSLEQLSVLSEESITVDEKLGRIQ